MGKIQELTKWLKEYCDNENYSCPLLFHVLGMMNCLLEILKQKGIMTDEDENIIIEGTVDFVKSQNPYKRGE